MDARRPDLAPLSEDAALPPPVEVVVRVDRQDVVATGVRPLLEALIDDGPDSLADVCHDPSQGVVQGGDTCLVDAVAATGRSLLR